VQVAQVTASAGRHNRMFVAATGALLVAVGQAAAGWSMVIGFAVSAVGALVLLVVSWQENRRQRILFLTLVVAFLLAATPLALASPLFAPVLAIALWPKKERLDASAGKALLVGGLVAIPCVLVVFVWWTSQTSIVFYFFLPDWAVSSVPVFVPVALCGIAAAFNSTWEELLWRKLLVENMPGARRWSRVASVAALSILFGLAHTHSLPSGLAGVIMTGVFAAVVHTLLLTLRRGMLAALIAHFIADFVLLLLITFGFTYD